MIKKEFVKAVAVINIIEGKPWLTDEQLDGLYEDFTSCGVYSLLDNNQEFANRLSKW
ncbi:MAG: hypothetical protein JKX98_12015 [Alcanivoracaceae bacterium]|nr:hypothetical protein [Alcanivoracaceae bacterium]